MGLPPDPVAVYSYGVTTRISETAFSGRKPANRGERGWHRGTRIARGRHICNEHGAKKQIERIDLYRLCFKEGCSIVWCRRGIMV